MQVSNNQMLQSNSYEQQRQLVNKEINQHKVDIDFSCFKKTDEEKSLAYKLRSEWRAEIGAKGISKRKFKHTFLFKN